MASRVSSRSQLPFLSRISSSFHQESQETCCVVGEHILSRSEGQYQTADGIYGIFEDSTINLDASELVAGENALLLTQCLTYCHRVVLRPFTFVLILIGWRPFRHGALPRHPLFWRVVNCVYPLLVFSLIVLYDSMLIYTCKYKLKHSDAIPPFGKTLASSPKKFSILNYFKGLNSSAEQLEATLPQHTCAHVIPIYVVPAILHLVAYIYGFFHFRIQEHEQIFSLMEKVFIRSQTSWGVPLSLVKNSRILLFTVAAWMAINICLEVLYNFAYTAEPVILREALCGTGDCSPSPMVLFVFKCIGTLLLMVVHVAVLFNYSSQCEMLIMYINGLVMWLREKSLLLREALHEILGVREYISVLNGALGKMTAICIVNYLQLTIIGIFFLDPFSSRNGSKDADTDPEGKGQWDAVKWTYRIMYPMVWIFAIAIPLVQGARLTKTGQKLRQVSFEMRVFGYQNCNSLELDSFLLFLSSATLRAKLFGVPVRPAILLLVFGGTVFCIVLFLVYECVSTKSFVNLF